MGSYRLVLGVEASSGSCSSGSRDLRSAKKAHNAQAPKSLEILPILQQYRRSNFQFSLVISIPFDPFVLVDCNLLLIESCMDLLV